MNCHLALQCLMVAEPENQIYLLTLELTSNAWLQLFQQIFELITPNDGL
jgi:hypothetical protein